MQAAVKNSQSLKKNEIESFCRPADHNNEEEYCDLTDDMVMPTQVSFLTPSTLDQKRQEKGMMRAVHEV